MVRDVTGEQRSRRPIFVATKGAFQNKRTYLQIRS
jgi:hypothetical protein